MKPEKNSAIAPAQLCSTVLGQRVLYHKKTAALVTEKPLQPESDLNRSNRVHAALFTAQEKLDTALFDAVRKKRIPLIARLISQGADVNAMRDGLSPLYWAVMHSSIELVACLLAHGANPNIAGPYGNMPLHEAALNLTPTKLKIADVLLIAGAQVNAQNDLGQTPLHFHKNSSPILYEKMAHLLLKAGANLHLTDIKGNEPLAKLSKERRDALIAFALFCHFDR